MDLQITDLHNLITVYRSKMPAWEPMSIDRCMTNGMIKLNGRGIPDLTQAGARKCKRIGLVEIALRTGVSIDLWDREPRTGIESTWYKARLKDGRYVFFDNASIFFVNHLHETPEYLQARHVTAEFERTLAAQLLISKTRETDSMRQIHPYALQRASLTGLEAVVLRGLMKDRVLRIQSRYYRLVNDLYPNATWWYYPNQGVRPIVVRSPHKGMGDSAWRGKRIKARESLTKIYALIMPIQAAWPVPKVDSMSV